MVCVWPFLFTVSVPASGLNFIVVPVVDVKPPDKDCDVEPNSEVAPVDGLLTVLDRPPPPNKLDAL